jgi:hypothetical protein
MVVNAFLSHEFLFDVLPGKKEREFGDVNISESYLVGNTAPGIYVINVAVKYFICGVNKSSTVTSTVEVEVEQ